MKNVHQNKTSKHRNINQNANEKSSHGKKHRFLNLPARNHGKLLDAWICCLKDEKAM